MISAFDLTETAKASIIIQQKICKKALFASFELVNVCREQIGPSFESKRCVQIHSRRLAQCFLDPFIDIVGYMIFDYRIGKCIYLGTRFPFPVDIVWY